MVCQKWIKQDNPQDPPNLPNRDGRSIPYSPYTNGMGPGRNCPRIAGVGHDAIRIAQEELQPG